MWSGCCLTGRDVSDVCVSCAGVYFGRCGLRLDLELLGVGL